jgi:hypothetical protein
MTVIRRKVGEMQQGNYYFFEYSQKPQVVRKTPEGECYRVPSLPDNDYIAGLVEPWKVTENDPVLPNIVCQTVSVRYSRQFEVDRNEKMLVAEMTEQEAMAVSKLY